MFWFFNLESSLKCCRKGNWQLDTDLNQSEISLEHLCLAGAQGLFLSEHCVTNKQVRKYRCNTAQKLKV